MAKGSICLRSLNETLNRVETRLQTLEARFTDLDSSLQNLAQKFELQAETLEKISQDTPWIWEPGERLGREEERSDSEGRGGAARPLGGHCCGGSGHCGRQRPGPGPAAAILAAPRPSGGSVGAEPGCGAVRGWERPLAPPKW
ncbi:single-pass membrane and coiled-coil domain-containing protein 1 [Phaethornis superciliosus]